LILVVQEQLEKLAGKKQRKTEDESQREKENAAAGLLQLPSKTTSTTIQARCGTDSTLRMSSSCLTCICSPSFRDFRGSTSSFQIGNDGQQGAFQGPNPIEQTEGTDSVAGYVDNMNPGVSRI
jgi:hypothetical protein